MNIQFRYANQITVGDEVLVPQNYELKTAKSLGYLASLWKVTSTFNSM